MLKNLFKGACLSTLTLFAISGCGGESNIPPLVSISSTLEVNESENKTLTATESDIDGSVVSFKWQQIEGPTVTLVDAESKTLSFIAPEVLERTELSFSVTVTDNNGAEDSATARVYVMPQVEFFPQEQVGLWMNTSGSKFLYFGDKTLTHYTYDSTCVTDVDNYLINDVSSIQISLKNMSGDTLINDFSINDSQLNFTLPGEEAEVYQFVEVGSPALYEGCYKTQTVDVEFTLTKLPQQLKVNRTESDALHTFRVFAIFDINKSKKIDIGDLVLNIGSYATSYDENEIIDLDKLIANVVRFGYSKDKNFASISNRQERNGQLTVEGNTLRFSFDNTKHALLSEIDSTTRFHAGAELNYPNPETEAYGNNTIDDEGPWLWVSDEHKDFFPELNKGRAMVNSGHLHIDVQGDQTGEADLVDIQSVKITLTEH